MRRVETDMTYEQARWLYTLASDQVDLKISNGWYGDPRQGSETFEDDRGALESLDRLGERLLDKVGLEEMEKLSKIVDAYLELGSLTPQEHRRAKLALCIGWEAMNLDLT